MDILFFELGLKSAEFRFRKYKKSFLLRKCKKIFLLRKYKNLFNIRARKFHSWKYKEFFHFPKYKKSFLLRKYKIFFYIRGKKFHFLKYKEFFSGWIFLFFGARAQALINTTRLEIIPIRLRRNKLNPSGGNWQAVLEILILGEWFLSRLIRNSLIFNLSQTFSCTVILFAQN